MTRKRYLAGAGWGRTSLLALLTVFGLSSCAKPEAVEGQPAVPAELRAFVLDEAPTDVPNKTYIDFDGQVELLGYALEPERLAPPGSKLQLKLFWRSTAKLGEGYKLFTHLLTPSGKRTVVEGAGPLRRGALSPSDWEPGKVYIDELEIEVPDDMEATRFSIVTGIAREPMPAEVAPKQPDEKPADKEQEKKSGEGSFSPVYLKVLSGLSDGQNGGIVATLETGVSPGTKRARAGKPPTKRGAAMPPGMPGMPPGMQGMPPGMQGMPGAPGAAPRRPPAPRPAPPSAPPTQ